MAISPVKNDKRKTWDAVAKREVANDILDGKISVSDVRRLHKLQPYQLYAWIGQAAVARLERQGRPQRHRRAEPATVPSVTGKEPGDELIAAALAELLRRRG